MSSRDGQSPSSPAVTAPLTVVPVTDVPPGAWVHHFNELSKQTQHALMSASPAGRLDIDTTASRLSQGDIAMFTDYARAQ